MNFLLDREKNGAPVTAPRTQSLLASRAEPSRPPFSFCSWNPTPETSNYPLRGRRFGDLRHSGGERAAIGAIDGQTVLRRADDRLRGSLVGDVAIVNRLEHIGVIFVRHHVNFRVDVEPFDGAALVGDLLVREARGESTALDDRRIVLALGYMIHSQRFDPGPRRR